MSDYLGFLAQQMRYEDFIREAETNRLIAQARAGKRGDHLYARVLAALGRRLETLGKQLQGTHLNAPVTTRPLAEQTH